MPIVPILGRLRQEEAMSLLHSELQAILGYHVKLGMGSSQNFSALDEYKNNANTLK